MLIRAINVTKSYRNEIGNVNREVLGQLSMEIDKGKKVAVMGPSGSGKTTLLNLIGTLDKPDSGDIFLDSYNLSEMNRRELLEFRNKKVGFVFQFHHLLPQCTLLENVMLPALVTKFDKSEVTRRAGELLQLLGIWEQRFNKPGELSGGECQRAAVARALINKPSILLADEPTGSLDARNAEGLMELLVNINREMGVTMVIATHSNDIAMQMDEVYKIVNGKVEPTRAGT